MTPATASATTLWGRRSAFNVQKALWTLDELGLDCRVIEVGGRFGGLDTAEFRRLNPHGRVPVLSDHGFVVWESHAIIRYLAARYGPGTLWPSDVEARSWADRWMDWSQSTLQPAFMAVFWGWYRTPERARDAHAIERALVQCGELLARLDAHLAGQPYLAGDAFTMGDIPAGTVLYRYCEMGLPVSLPANAARWYERLQQRPGYRAHVMVPFDELRGRLDF